MPLQLFSIGIVTGTRAALERLEIAGQNPAELVHRHATGEFGDVDWDSVGANFETIRRRVGTILSIYGLLDGEVIWVATSLQENGEAHTCVMLPHEW